MNTLSLSHVGERLVARLINREPESFLRLCGIRSGVEASRHHEGPASCEVPFAPIAGRSLDGACRVDVAVRVRRNLAIPIELKLGQTRLSKQRFESEWLRTCEPSHASFRAERQLTSWE